MSSSKHPKTDEDRKAGLGADAPRPPDDLDRDPGIGTSKGVHTRTGAEPGAIAGDNTSEGDVMNDVNAQGGVDEKRTGRTNK